MRTQKIVMDALRQRCKNEGDWILNRRQRYFYTIKALICWPLRRYNMGHYTDVSVSYTPQGLIPKTKYGSDSFILKVGYGYWRNWYAYLLDDRYTEG